VKGGNDRRARSVELACAPPHLAIYVPNPVVCAGKIKAGLRPGGLFVLEFFLDEGDGGGKPAELRAQLADGFDILRDEVVDDRPDGGQDRARLVRFVARKR
jgi:hypothetical protein